MADTALPEIKPGDIISAAFMNTLIAKMTDLERRLVDLESMGSTGTVTVTSFDPPVQQAIGQVLVVNGVGFAFPPEQNVVLVDSVRVFEFRLGSTTSRLEFLLPHVVGDVPAAGRNAVVEIRNANGTVRRLYRLTPEVPVVGDPPIISNVSRADGQAGPLIVGLEAFIDGENFSSKPAENMLTLQFTPSAGADPVIIPRTNEDPIPVAGASETRLRFKVPAMPELPLNRGKTLTVRVRVGSHPEAARNTDVLRTS